MYPLLEDSTDLEGGWIDQYLNLALFKIVFKGCESSLHHNRLNDPLMEYRICVKLNGITKKEIIKTLSKSID